MPTYQVTQFFKALGYPGWTESYYLVRDTAAAAIVRADDIIVARRPLLAKGNRIAKIRASDVDEFRDSRAKSYSDAQGGGTYGGIPGPAAGNNEQAWDRLLLRCEAGAFVRRSMEMGGIPRGVISQDGSYDPAPAWVAAFPNWSDQLTAVASPARIATFPSVGDSWPILEAVLPAGRPYNLAITVSLVANAALALAPGAVIRLGRSVGYANYQGLWVVEDAGEAVALGRKWTLQARRFLVGLPAPGAGKIGWVAKMAPGTTYGPITSVSPERGVRRKTGGPFDRVAGITPRPGR